MNNYETVFIMNPVLSEEQIKETVNKFVSFIKTNKGTVSHQENWGLKKLKYTIQKKKTGFRKQRSWRLLRQHLRGGKNFILQTAFRLGEIKR